MSSSDHSPSPKAEDPAEKGNGQGAATGQGSSAFPLANRVTAIGHAIWLMSRSPLHKHLMVTDIEWLLMPPIMLNQFHLWQDNGRPHGFASWAYFGEEQEERIAKKGIRRLMPTDWKTGEALWLIDFVAPFGQQEAMVEELRLKILPGKRMKMLQARPEGGTGVVEW
jgi:cytolysin-activating lysine-acyltransferase